MEGKTRTVLALMEGEICLQAPQAGEIVSFECDDGTAVEYKEVIIEMAPFFGGHIIGDRKYA